MLKRAFAVVVLVGLVAAGCGGGQGTPTRQPEPEEPTQMPSQAGGEAGEMEGSADQDTAARSFRIVPEQSQASFELGEILAGNPNQVVGTTRAVEGSFSLDFDNPTQVTFAPVRIEADSFETDDGRRDRAIERFILRTGQSGNEFVTYQVTDVTGLPGRVEVGESYEVELTGDLTVVGVTKQTAFDGTVTAASDNRVEGSFETLVRWADFDLSIPQVPSVADVDEEVSLTLDFAALAQ